MGYKEFGKKIKIILNKLGLEEDAFYKNENVSYLNNKTVAIDFTHNIHKALRKNDLHYLIHIMNMFNKLKHYNIKIILVFDGRPPSEKNNELNKKKKKDKKIYIELQELLIKVDAFNKINIEESNIKNEYIKENDNDNIKEKENCEKKIKRNKKKLIKVNKDIKEEVKEFCDIFNIPYIHINKEEADPICSYLVRNGIADVCISNDYDLIGFQCPIIIKDLEYFSDDIKIIDTNKLCSLLQFDNIDKLSFFLLLFGNDYININNNNIDLIEIHTNLVSHSINEVLEMYKDTLDKEKIMNVLYNVYLKNIQISDLSILKNKESNLIDREKFDNLIEKYKDNKFLIKNIKTYYTLNKYYFYKYEF